jgi:hypothetical protein
MLKVIPAGSNQTIINTKKAVVLFSYQTPVAALIDGQFYETNVKYSKTTSRHINKWIAGNGSIEKPQSFFDSLI